MRPQHHQKSRSRGRGRKPQNPLSRNFESNGPDVKIRGNASHIAEKYSTLARDALASGDTVMAENYFQHAEHYNRIVAAAQAQKAEEQQQQQANGRAPQAEGETEGSSEGASEQAAEAKPEANGAGESQEDATKEPRQQKNGRGRRPRKQASDDGDKKPSEENGDTNGSADVPVEAITEDASKLPESITGGFLGEES